MADVITADTEVVSDRRRGILANARREAEARRLDEVLIVDVDCHIMETLRFKDLVPYIDHPQVRRIVERYPSFTSIIPGGGGDREVAGRIFRDPPIVASYGHASPEQLLEEMDTIGIDYAFIFPTPMLNLGMSPDVELEVALAQGYNRWVTDTWLQVSDRIRALLYLPFGDADASYREVVELGERRGVEGFMVTSARTTPVHHRSYMKVYAALEERGLPIGFHGIVQWREGALAQLNRFLSAHAIGFPLSNMIHLANIVINGLPQRFPRLRWIFLESGLFWIPFIAHRLDNEYRMRPSEAPLLERLPSEYIRDFYFSTQPLEVPERPEHLEMVMDMIDGRRHLLYASDWPHWDFDLPSRVYDLPFLSEADRRAILGGNAAELFGLPTSVARRPGAGGDGR
ncbi:MAG TPA: amidohydrolase family protein [Candidatus Dormibacteraeota bacterium]|nr:amidohydrolase family protein [Candidatus Dormibacteraeota bacterium]